jgi:single-strand DNA-binding protein
VADPEMRYTPSNTAVVEFRVVTNRKFKVNGEEREEVCWMKCTAFGKTGEIINEHFHKGSIIALSCHLKTEEWQDKQGGGKRSAIVAVVDEFWFVPRESKESDSPPQSRPASQPTTRTGTRPAPATQQFQDGGGAAADDDGDIPFSPNRM